MRVSCNWFFKITVLSCLKCVGIAFHALAANLKRKTFVFLILSV